MRDPLTGETKLVVLDRAGHTEKGLAQVLSDPNTTRDRKDHALSMYLFERGAQDVSLIVDMFRYKGQHSKQSQVFQSRMRLDFETFVNSFVAYLDNQARLIGATLGVDIKKEKEEFVRWVKMEKQLGGKDKSYKDFRESNELSETIDYTKIALVEMAMYAQDESDALIKGIEDIVKARMAVKGGGVYVDKSGKPYSVNDPELDSIIKKEREIEEEAEKEND